MTGVQTCALPILGSASATAAGAIYSGTINADALNSRRQDNATVLDLRVERPFKLGGTVRVRALFDMFNITNTNANETRTITTGVAFLRPTAVLAPRTMRIGARVSW